MGTKSFSTGEDGRSPTAVDFVLPAGRSATRSSRRLPAFALKGGRASLDRAGETDSLATVRRREHIFRRSIVVGDALAATIAVVAAIDVGTSYTLRVGFLLVLPIIVLVAKVQGLYDHDELVIRKSTLDEVPRLVNLATLVTLLVWLSRHFIVIGAPSTVSLLKLWIALLVLTLLGRITARGFAARYAPRERCFFVGDLRSAKRLRSKLGHGSSVDLVGAITDENVELDQDALVELTKRFDIHRVIIASASGVAEDSTIDLVRAAKAIGLRVTLSRDAGRRRELAGHG